MMRVKTDKKSLKTIFDKKVFLNFTKIWSATQKLRNTFVPFYKYLKMTQAKISISDVATRNFFLNHKCQNHRIT